MLARMNTSDSSIHFDLVIPSMVAANHKQVIRLAAHETAKLIGITDRILADRFAETEKESPSAIGDGIAITHLQMGSLQNAVSVFIRLKNPTAMGAPDNKDVDILCLLLTPEREGSSYLRSLARLSRLLRNERTCTKLRAAADEKAIRQILEHSSINQLAA